MRTLYMNSSLTILLVIFSISISVAQDTIKTDNTLLGQSKDILQKSKNNEQGFKIINPSRLEIFNKNLSDSLTLSRQKLTTALATLNTQDATIISLTSEIKTKEENLSKSANLVDNIGFLGMTINKSTYNLAMWGLLFLLTAILIFTIFQSGSYRKEARYRIKLFEDLSKEFQAYKVKANDKEKLLARELQTAKNRIDELTSR